ncbi:MAG TPA: helix-turn-helix domain-containing protein [Gammaproteobacteria bacterium]|nr:helix-turn-helix domain-containing protein [Gammaproteobacteria bacterium]
MNVNDLLQELGFSDYEARAYVALIGAGVSNGYEVAKAAGMPRANVYTVLERLVERGGARRLDTADGVRYAAVKPEQLLRRLDRRHRRTLEAVEKALTALEHADEAAPVFNLRNYAELMAQARAVIDGANKELLVGIQPPEAAALADHLREARERGVAITTLCMQACGAECGGCQGRIHRYDLAPARDGRWLLLVDDECRALAGEVTDAGASAVVTRQRQIVDLIAAYIRQSLALAILTDDVGDQFEGLLSGPARDALNALQPEGDFLARLSDITGKKLTDVHNRS